MCVCTVRRGLVQQPSHKPTAAFACRAAMRSREKGSFASLWWTPGLKGAATPRPGCQTHIVAHTGSLPVCVCVMCAWFLVLKAVALGGGGRKKKGSLFRSVVKTLASRSKAGLHRAHRRPHYVQPALPRACACKGQANRHKRVAAPHCGVRQGAQVERILSRCASKRWLCDPVLWTARTLQQVKRGWRRCAEASWPWRGRVCVKHLAFSAAKQGRRRPPHRPVVIITARRPPSLPPSLLHHPNTHHSLIIIPPPLPSPRKRTGGGGLLRRTPILPAGLDHTITASSSSFLSC